MDFATELNKRREILKEVTNKDIDTMKSISDLIVRTIKSGNKIMTAGNGGSAANAQHITGDIVGRYKLERKAYPAVSLTVDTSLITAISNDYGYDQVFSRQIEGIGKENDLLIVSSSSARSRNLVEAVKQAKKMNIKTIGVCGNKGGDIGKELDHSIEFEFSESDLVEEITMSIFHIILMEAEARLSKEETEEE